MTEAVTFEEYQAIVRKLEAEGIKQTIENIRHASGEMFGRKLNWRSIKKFRSMANEASISNAVALIPTPEGLPSLIGQSWKKSVQEAAQNLMESQTLRHDQLCDQLEASIDDYQAKAREFDVRTAEKDKHIALLEAENSKKWQKIAQQESSLASLEEELATLIAESQGYKATIQVLQARLDDLQNEYNGCLERMSSLSENFASALKLEMDRNRACEDSIMVEKANLQAGLKAVQDELTIAMTKNAVLSEKNNSLLIGIKEKGNLISELYSSVSRLISEIQSGNSELSGILIKEKGDLLSELDSSVSRLISAIQSGNSELSGIFSDLLDANYRKTEGMAESTLDTVRLWLDKLNSDKKQILGKDNGG